MVFSNLEARVLVAFALLALAAKHDWQRREIGRNIWGSLLLVGLAFLALDLRFGIHAAWRFIFSLTSTFVISYPMHRWGRMGGGDVKVLLGIASMFPSYPWPAISVFPFPALGALFNGIFLAATASPFFFLYNLRHLRSVGSIGELRLLFLGYRRRLSSKRYYEVPLKVEGDYAWVTPALPFVIPLTIGLALSLAWGDLPSYIVMQLSY